MPDWVSVHKRVALVWGQSALPGGNWGRDRGWSSEAPSSATTAAAGAPERKTARGIFH
ncbi:hypothetical protein [Acetobacter sp. DsW_063]|uniref:hypothetical protein n=1 Tax=Acetobacter sp. DsW_063 TaxID=1514894 RepID=UPI001302DBFF|nr:hypothetical protein [Acetobacter sp. DsW_063]